MQLVLADRAGELAQRLAHQARDAGRRDESPISPSISAARQQRRDGVDDHDVDRAGAHELPPRSPAPARRCPAGRRAGRRCPRRARGHTPGSSACSTSMNAAVAAALLRARRRCAARAWSCRSSPGRRSRRCGRAGTPPMPSARSSDSDPVEMASTFTGMSSPRRMMAPLPKFFSIWARAVSSAFLILRS